jgi:redox-sensitive bicupin YhaK (pirin superfamily)
MEIVSYVISGALEHQDSMGNKTVIRPGEVQRMSAGTGVQHSEINHYADQESHFLQIWILPDKMGRTPSYGQKDFTERLQSEALVQVLSPNGGAGSIAIHQDVNVFVSRARQGSDLDLPVSIQRRGWLQLISGAVEVLGESLKDGDGLAISKTASAKLATNTDAHFLYFDLP